MGSELEQTLRHAALRALECKNSIEKVRLVLAIDDQLPIGNQVEFSPGVGRPDKPELVHPAHVPTRKVSQSVGAGHAVAFTGPY